MKKILNILWSITLIGTSTTSLFACNTPQYSEDELAKLKEENKIDTKDENIKNNLEWITPQEKPFNTVDNKYYYVVWRGDKNDSWYLTKFNNNTYDTIIIRGYKDDYSLMYRVNGYFGIHSKKNNFEGKESYFHYWKNKNDNYFKSVYRWNLDTTEPNLILNENGNVKVN
ncbi:lipoprotein [Spiroplasma endosymbiont of Polydrusus pterygomalis]|uniref:lipoprotein n=1 Tax=Spiroplasma endosymbiont of Polydrusus pterygomalis TaxID=3139327 RepID=UPI003CCAE0F5